MNLKLIVPKNLIFLIFSLVIVFFAAGCFDDDSSSLVYDSSLKVEVEGGISDSTLTSPINQSINQFIYKKNNVA